MQNATENLELERTEPELINKIWWWRRETKNRVFIDQNHTTRSKNGSSREWKEVLEPIAFAYEMARRHDRSIGWPSFSSLSRAEQLDFQCIIPPAPEAIPPWKTCAGFQGFVSKFSSEEYLGPIVVNLKVSNNLIIEALLKEIEIARIRGRISVTDEKRGRGLSWRWPELLDLKHCRVPRDWSDTERSSLTRARERAAVFYENLKSTFRE